MHTDTARFHARLLTQRSDRLRQIDGGAVAANDRRIVYPSPAAETLDAVRVVDCGGRLLTLGHAMLRTGERLGIGQHLGFA